MLPQHKLSRRTNIFISYRRDDSPGHVGRLYDSLIAYFSPHYIFMDLNNIVPGDNFVETIEKAIGSSSVLLVVIGKHWLWQQNGTKRLLEGEEDFVRIEIETAIKEEIKINPVLVNGGKLPESSELPDKLAPLTKRHFIELSDNRWRDDTDKLIKILQPYGPGRNRNRKWSFFELIRVGLSQLGQTAKKNLLLLRRVALILVLFLMVGFFVYATWRASQPKVILTDEEMRETLELVKKTNYDSKGFRLGVQNTMSTKVRAKLELNANIIQNGSILRSGDLIVDETWDPNENKYFFVPYRVNHGSISDDEYQIVSTIALSP